MITVNYANIVQTNQSFACDIAHESVRSNGKNVYSTMAAFAILSE